MLLYKKKSSKIFTLFLIGFLFFSTISIVNQSPRESLDVGKNSGEGEVKNSNELELEFLPQTYEADAIEWRPIEESFDIGSIQTDLNSDPTAPLSRSVGYPATFMV